MTLHDSIKKHLSSVLKVYSWVSLGSSIYMSMLTWFFAHPWGQKSRVPQFSPQVGVNMSQRINQNLLKQYWKHLKSTPNMRADTSRERLDIPPKEKKRNIIFSKVPWLDISIPRRVHLKVTVSRISPLGRCDQPWGPWPYPDKSIRFGPRALRAPDLEPFIDMADNSTTSADSKFEGDTRWGHVARYLIDFWVWLVHKSCKNAFSLKSWKIEESKFLKKSLKGLTGM